MKTLLSIALVVSMCCLLPSNGMAADEAKPALFTIVSAQFGAGETWSDVSDKIKAMVKNDALIIDPANDYFGDPIVGTKKSLKVVVKYKGKEVAFQTGAGGIAGNYVAFRNQTANEFAIFPYCTSPSRIAINGIQIVAGERSISINFTALSDASAVLGPADVAGVIPRGNWNNIEYNGNTYGFTPKDDTGTTLESTFVNCRLNTAYPGNHGYTCTVGNDRLMKYFCGTDETFPSTAGPLIRVSGLPASFLATGYSIYVYSDANNNSDPHRIDLGTSLLDTNNQSAGISTICAATIVDSDNWPGSGGGTFTEGATLTINKAVLDAKVEQKAAGEDPAKQLLQMTGGARTKIVWSRGVDRPGGFSIMLLDTSEGRERVLAEQTHCRIPFITPSGNRVIVDDMSATSDEKRIYVMDMNGNKKELSPAFCAMGVAEDPPGTEWAYYADAKHDANPRGRLWRVQIDNPTVKELVWDKTSICWQWAFTRDGKTAAAALPWPGAHIANLPNGDYQQVHDSGCMVALAPSGKRMLHCTAMQFGVEHGGISVHTAPWGGSDFEINLGNAPGVNNQTLLWPSWALYDERFFVITGPWTKGASPGNILFAQFNEAFNGIARWVQVTQCPEGLNDCNASCWIESGPDVKASPQVDPIQTKAAEARVPAPAAGGWPADRQDLIFLWENRKGAFLAYDRDGKASPSLILMPRDRARFDHNQGLWPEAGAFPVPHEVKLLQAQKPANLTLEAYLTPGQANGAALAEIISFSAKSDDANLVLGQLGDKLVMAMKGGAKPSELCALTAGEPVHVIVTYAPGKLTCYKNGKPAGRVDNFRGSPANWTEQHLVFGSNWDGKNPWSGHLEGIAIYKRALNPQEAVREHAAFAEKLKVRKPVPRIAIQAKLLAKTKAATFEDIAPYTQATAAYEYEVEKVVSGQYKEKKIRVVHHTLIDRKMLPVSQWEIGKSYTLELEPREANPQLDDGIDVPRDDLPIDLDAALYYDVGPLTKTP